MRLGKEEDMYHRVLCSMIAAGMAYGLAFAAPAFSADGKALFEKHCAVCHPDGRNIINPNKTLKQNDLMANGITGPGEIVRKMRDPGPGMRVFTEADLPQAEADAIARYIWDTVSR